MCIQKIKVCRDMFHKYLSYHCNHIIQLNSITQELLMLEQSIFSYDFSNYCCVIFMYPYMFMRVCFLFAYIFPLDYLLYWRILDNQIFTSIYIFFAMESPFFSDYGNQLGKGISSYSFWMRSWLCKIVESLWSMSAHM